VVEEAAWVADEDALYRHTLALVALVLELALV
jgi:hypothetical protein